jgi:D-arabinitol dehydrogenase (NADP+)
MKSAEFSAPLRARVVDVDPPDLAPDAVLIAVRRAGVCGTDLHIYHGDYALARYPLTPGHEFSGEVVAVGERVRGFKPGDRVTADPNLPCGACAFCQRRQFNQCLELEVVGVTRSGAFAEHVAVPESAVYPIGGLSFADAALLEPLACVVWGLQQVQVQAGDRVLIFGAGPMGLLMMQAVRRAGASYVAVVDKEPWRLKLAEDLGASAAIVADKLSRESFGFAPHGFEVVADATGVPQVIEGAVGWVRPGGKLWVFGVAPATAKASFVPFDIFRYDLKVIGSFALNKTFHEAIQLVGGGALELSPLVSHALPLAEFGRGLELAEKDPKRMKIQFELA